MAKIHTLLHHHGSNCNFCGCTVYVATPADPFHATVDHDIPKARGGSNDFSNLILACVLCNTSKGDMTGGEFRSFMIDFKLPQSYVDYLAARIKKRLAGRAPIVVHESMSLNVVAAGLYVDGNVAETRKIVAGWEKARMAARR